MSEYRSGTEDLSGGVGRRGIEVEDVSLECDERWLEVGQR